MQENLSLAELLALLPASERKAHLASLTDAQALELLWDWRFWARPKQLPPLGDWATWIIRAGRGFGKTRSGGGWVHERAMEYPGRWMALIARNSADARDYMIEGPGGILKNTRPRDRPIFEVSKRRVTWPNGSWGTIYTDEDPDQIRGFSGDTAWLDEFAKYKHPEDVWSNLEFGMREASTDQPRKIITTTPRPLLVLKRIEQASDTTVVVGSSYENRSNLDPKWFANTLERYRGTRLGRQEIEAEILDDVPGALWSRRSLDDNRKRIADVPPLVRVKVAIDPSITSGESSAETGISVGGIAANKHGFLLEDASLRGSPDEWARRAIAMYRKYEADGIVAEANQGGEMVERVIRAVDPNVPVKLVRATRGKYIRAEPVSSLYEQGRISHVGTFPELEDQMIAFTPESAADRRPGESPDRVDSVVWLWTDLFDDMVLPQREERDMEDDWRSGRRGPGQNGPSGTTGYG
jgi:phage terminase large subunit-like protein